MKNFVKIIAIIATSHGSQLVSNEAQEFHNRLAAIDPQRIKTLLTITENMPQPPFDRPIRWEISDAFGIPPTGKLADNYIYMLKNCALVHEFLRRATVQTQSMNELLVDNSDRMGFDNHIESRVAAVCNDGSKVSSRHLQTETIALVADIGNVRKDYFLARENLKKKLLLNPTYLELYPLLKLFIPCLHILVKERLRLPLDENNIANQKKAIREVLNDDIIVQRVLDHVPAFHYSQLLIGAMVNVTRNPAKFNVTTINKLFNTHCVQSQHVISGYHEELPNSLKPAGLRMIVEHCHGHDPLEFVISRLDEVYSKDLRVELCQKIYANRPTVAIIQALLPLVEDPELLNTMEHDSKNDLREEYMDEIDKGVKRRRTELLTKK